MVDFALSQNFLRVLRQPPERVPPFFLVFFPDRAPALVDYSQAGRHGGEYLSREGVDVLHHRVETALGEGGFHRDAAGEAFDSFSGFAQDIWRDFFLSQGFLRAPVAVADGFGGMADEDEVGAEGEAFRGGVADGHGSRDRAHFQVVGDRHAMKSKGVAKEGSGDHG